MLGLRVPSKNNRNGDIIMGERKYDQMLQIKTIGLREWRKQTDDYNRYEATPYIALEKLFKQYKLKPEDSIVDFGSGRGRVSFYIHNHFNVPVTGVENNDKTYDESLYNKAVYREKNKHLEAPIRVEVGLAENYPVRPEDNKFYFFNPCCVNIYKQLIDNIFLSVGQERRPVAIIHYYPLPAFEKFLNK